MTEADIPLGMRLKEQNGWNQTEEDWRRFLKIQPETCFIGLHNDTRSATITCLTFGESAWIGMMLVDSKHQRQGIGRCLMSFAIEKLQADGVKTIRLDASDQGRPLYESLGFQAQRQIDRFTSITQKPSGSETDPEVMPLSQEKCIQQLDEFIALDQFATGQDRSSLLQNLSQSKSTEIKSIRRNNRLVAMGFSRPGSNHQFLGPIVARQTDDLLRMVESFLDQSGHPKFAIDVPRDSQVHHRIVSSCHWTKYRSFTRMCLGRELRENDEFAWTSAGPELG